MLPSVHHPRYQAFRAHIRALRKRAGLTQVQLAQRLAVDQTYVSKLERGDRYIDALFYFDWCHACHVNPADAIREFDDADSTA